MDQEALLPAVAWLAASREPAMRRAVQREFLGQPWSGGSVTGGRIVGSLLAGQQADGSFGVHPYRKWTGAHWRLVSLVGLGVTEADAPSMLEAAGTVLDWLHGDQHRSQIRTIDGLTRRCASQEGNALYVCSGLGMQADPRVIKLAHDLTAWQWPDGGWNCDLNASGRRSSFHETLPAAKGLYEFWKAGGDPAARTGRNGRPGCSSVTGCLNPAPPAGPSTRSGSSSATRSTGTTGYCRPCFCWPGWG